VLFPRREVDDGKKCKNMRYVASVAEVRSSLFAEIDGVSRSA